MNSKTERELTPAEKARAKKFEAIKNQLISDGYETVDLTVDVKKANIMALVLSAPIILLFTVLFVVVNLDNLKYIFSNVLDNYLLGFIIFMVAYIVLVFVHEFTHGVTWALFAKKHFKSISFGFIKQYLTPYCTCDEPLKKSHYLIGALMPTIVLGVIPSVVSVFIGSPLVFVIGAIMIMAGGGDLTISLNLIKFKTRAKSVLYVDHPYLVGLMAFTK